ncbi:GntR family transcriptional regulator [Glutamicibacter sp.]|uniref:GntR family transcriptional regulator n=1 Tax=Glutamicibacter sp. TaxID=1931995 RepID=UPI003D6C5E5C
MASSLSEQLTLTLRERINRGELAPGTLIIEPALAQEFEVSKTPVRESLRQLTSEGLLQVLPKKGYLVCAISLNDVYEVLELRSLLEPHVAGQVASMHSAALVVSLAGHLEAQERLSVSDPIASMHAAQRFHSELAAASRNSRLVASLENCFTQTARAHYVLPSMQPYMSQSDELAEHQAIFAAIQNSDPAAATEAMAVHLESIRRAMLGHH